MRQTLIAILVLITTSTLQAENWPQFLGPNRNSISTETSLARSWPKNGPETLWTIDVGLGYGGASIQGNKVYLLDRQDDQRDVLRCLDLDTGKQLWQCAHKIPGRLSHNGSRSVPTLDEERVYATGPFGQVYCIDQKTHQFLWIVDMVEQFQAKPPRWGFSQSPLLVDDLIIIAPMSDEAGLVALNRQSGQVIWKSQSTGGNSSYASPILAQVAGTQGVLFLTNDQLSFLDPKTGKILWTYNGYSCRNTIPAPTVISDDRIFITGGYNAGSVMIQVKKSGTDYNISELYRMEKHGSKIQPALFYQGHFYANFKKLVCFDPENNPQWASGKFSAGNLIIADKMIYILNSDTGELSLVELNPTSYNLLARAQVLDGAEGEIYGPMALSQGKLIIRDQTQMKCLNIQKK